jgi:hypothetical protein
MDERGFRRAVARQVSAGSKARRRGYVDDRATAQRNHPRCGALRDKKRASQIGVEDAVEVGLGLLEKGLEDDDACTIDEDVGSASELALDRAERSIERLDTPDVEDDPGGLVNSCARCRPIPLEAPVTSATWPFKLKVSAALPLMAMCSYATSNSMRSATAFVGVMKPMMGFEPESTPMGARLYRAAFCPTIRL